MPVSEPYGVRWSRGLTSNVVALAAVGMTALTVNLVIAAEWGAAGLGVFAQTMTWFILAAQVATLGVHYAVLPKVGAAQNDADARAVVAAGLRAVLPATVVVGLASAMVAPTVGAALRSPATGESIRLVSLALIFHAVTKVLGAGLNGRQCMHRFAAVSLGRAVGLAFGALGLWLVEASLMWLGFIIVCGEGFALLAAIAVSGPLPVLRTDVSGWELVRFGVRAAPAALAAEANTRVDVAMLGLLLDDRTVGVYALAVTAYEGVFQAAVVLRNQLNGLIARALAIGRPDEIELLHRRLRWRLVAGSATLVVLSSLAFGPTVRLLGLPSTFLSAQGPLLLLLAGIAVVAHLVPFDQILILGGRPVSQTRIVFLSITVNIVANLVLIPRLGAIGAATGTALALIVLAYAVAIRADALLGVRLGGALGSARKRDIATPQCGRP